MKANFVLIIGLLLCINCSPSVTSTVNETTTDYSTVSSSQQSITSTPTKSTPSLTSTVKSTTVDSSTASSTHAPTTTTATISTSSHVPDECELQGACELGEFLPLGECENCYCQCAANSSTTYQWKKYCCPSDGIWNPNAWPNPNSCDTCENMENCSCSGTSTISMNTLASITMKASLFFIITKAVKIYAI